MPPDLNKKTLAAATARGSGSRLKALGLDNKPKVLRQKATDYVN